MGFIKKLILKLRLNKQILIYIGIGVISLILLITILSIALNNKKNPKKETIIRKDSKYLSENFINLFKNEIPEELEDKVYIVYNVENEELGKYKINIKMPMLKLKTETAKKINKEITDTFAKKMLDVIKQKEAMYTIYNVDFFTTMNDNILTLAIKCNLKEGKTAQRTIIKTYNYDLENEKILALSDFIEINQLDRAEIQSNINSEIEKQVKKTEAIKGEGYSIYERTINDTIYQIDNTEEFMLDKEGNLYIIYPYGNKNLTGEMDVITIVNNE